MTINSRCVVTVALDIGLMASFAMAQSHELDAAAARYQRQLELSANRNKLDVSIKLDRDLYFPAEDAIITIRVVNATASILEVPAPFEIVTGGINLIVRNGKRYPNLDSQQWVHSMAHPHGGPGPAVLAGYVPPLPPTIWLPPGQPVERTLRISDTACLNTFLGVCRLPEEEGEYGIAYDYHHKAFAQFRIVYPKLEQWTETILAGPYQRDEIGPDAKPTGKIIVSARRVRAAVLGYEGQHIIVIAGWHAPSDPRIIFDANGVFGQSLGRHFGPYRRVVSSADPITALHLESDKAENVTIGWMQAGVAKSIRLDQNHDPIP